MPKVKEGTASAKKPAMVNRQAVGTHKGKLITRQSGKYGTGANEPGKRQGAKPKPVALVPTPSVNGTPVVEAPINNIAPALKDLEVDIDSLIPDPMNARLHPERNMEAIQSSLALYGQVKPIVVRRESRVIVAGNGTTEAAKALGWTRIAATFVDFDEAQAAGFGLADNRSAELAKWDFAVVAKIDKLMEEMGGSRMVGWSQDELEVLRAADWTPPTISEDEYNGAASKEIECPSCGHKWSM